MKGADRVTFGRCLREIAYQSTIVRQIISRGWTGMPAEGRNMPAGATTRVIEHLQRAALLRDGAGLGDGELLGRFLERRDEAALAALIRRHGPMVWGVCRRLLSHHDAEDAFQATFIVLVRKAASIVPRHMVGNWLYGVAHQTALQAKRTATRRRAREVQVTEMPDTATVQPDQWPDVRPLLDQELSRLPDRYRAVIVLCDLEDRTRKEVARQLGVPEGTVAGRLARARALLARRLAGRGVTLSAGALAAVLAQNVASASVAISLVSSTVQSATLVAVGQTAATGAISAKVAALTDGVLKVMLMNKLKAAIAVVLVLGFLITGATILTCRTAAAQDEKERLTVPAKLGPPAAKPKPAPARAARSLDIVIAQHVIVWDNRIRTWDEVVTELRAIRKAQGKPIHPNFYFTNGAHSAGHWKTYQAKAFEIYKELFEPAGMSLGSISPRAGPRYDVLQKAEDLVPDPKTLRSGIVIEKGRPKAGVLVVLVPEEGLMPVVLKPDLTLRDRHDEVWTVTGPDGRFTLPVQPVHAVDKLTEPPTYALAAIAPTGYRLANIPAEGKSATIELQPLARVELKPVEGKPQRIDLSLRGDLPDRSPGFSIYEIDLRDKSLTLPLPAGKITIQRAFPQKDGGSRSYPAETVHIAPGDSRKIVLPNVTEEEAERKWREESLRPRGNGKKPEGK
jgi:RNA polymerase sigma factor (sigma-70 family)